MVRSLRSTDLIKGKSGSYVATDPIPGGIEFNYMQFCEGAGGLLHGLCGIANLGGKLSPDMSGIPNAPQATSAPR